MAKTSVTIPLEIEMNRKIITTAEFNKKFKLQGADKLVENLIVTNDRESYKQANSIYYAQNEKVNDLASKLNQDFNLALSDVHGCYSGVASEAVTILGGLADGPFSDQLGLFGYKYKSESKLIDWDDAEAATFLNEQSQTWKNWKGTDESILVLFHISDDGDDVNEAIITKCN
jgi:hypothetical protein